MSEKVPPIDENQALEGTIQKMKNDVSKMREKELKAYLQKNAENWKEIHKKNCITITQMYEQEQKTLDQLDKRYEIINSQYTSVYDASKGYTEGLLNSDTEKERIEKNEIEFNQSLNQYSAQLKSKKDEVKKFEKSITKESVSKLYKLLEKKQPPFLSKMAECMVSLLRGQTYASPSDVEMYLKNYSSLMYKMSKIDPGTVPKEATDVNAQELDKLANEFTDHDKADFAINSEYIHMFAWCQHFCKLCETGRVVREIEEKLESGKKRVVFLAEYKKRAASCLEDLEIFDLETLAEEREIMQSHMEKIKNQQEQRQIEIKSLQSKYIDFEDTFFDELNKFKRESMVKTSKAK